MECLNCHLTMVNIQESHFFKHAAYDVCDHCGGMWLDRGELDKLAMQTTGSVEASSIDILHQEPKNWDPGFHPFSPRCPRCKNCSMVKMHFMGESRILLDYCEHCGGMWIDGGELTKINQFIRWFDRKAKPSKFGRYLVHKHGSLFHRIEVMPPFENEKVK